MGRSSMGYKKLF